MGRWSNRSRPLSAILVFGLLGCLCFGLLAYDTTRATTGTAVVKNIVVMTVLVLLFGVLIHRLLHNCWDTGTAVLGFIAPAVGVGYLFGPEKILRSEVVYVFWVLLVLVQIRILEPDTGSFGKKHGALFLSNGLLMIGASLTFGGGLGVIVGAVLTLFGVLALRDPSWFDQQL